MNKRRILIVVDSVLMRRALTTALARNPRLEVAGSAPNGRVALMKIPLLNPDAVALDIELPEKGCLETLGAISVAYPQLPVIILSVATGRAASETLDAVTMGAKDYLMKPDIATTAVDALQVFTDELASKIAFHCPVVSYGKPTSAPPLFPPPLFPPPSDTALYIAACRPVLRADVVAIGASVGGPDALMDLIPRFPPDFPVPILIVQHMSTIFTKLLATRLNAKCQVHVAEGSLDQVVMPGQAWIAPGDLHMSVVRKGDVVRIHTCQGLPVNSCRPAADVLFKSVAEVYGAHALAVVMTGMGQDGFRGCQEISAAGGQVLVQDEASSVVWGMPGFVVRGGIADQILPLKELGPEIVRRVWSQRPESNAPLLPKVHSGY
jgi:two-component system, chemotaxis family, protein-glutamate methylesterase/glutaminase